MVNEIEKSKKEMNQMCFMQSGSNEQVDNLKIGGPACVEHFEKNPTDFNEIYGRRWDGSIINLALSLHIFNLNT